MTLRLSRLVRLTPIVVGLIMPFAACRSGPISAPASSAAANAPAPAGAPAVGGGPRADDDPIVARGILRRDGERIVDATGRPVRWTGVAFGNQVWSGRPLPVTDHDESDFSRLRAMGMNAARFYMHYRTFEDDTAPGVFKEAGWEWLDRNVMWARRHGVYLILNLHVPPGGYQSNGEGAALWDSPATQDRVVALWRAIAARHANQAIIAGYDILNEPGVSKSRAQWTSLAGRVAKAIRQVDPNHIVIVERVNSVAQEWKNDADMNFVLIDDPNVVYTFHFYDPLTYTHQFAPWVHYGEGGRWPDEEKVGRSEYATWSTVATFDSAPLSAGDSPWTHAESEPLATSDAGATVGHIALVGGRVGAGLAAFDDLIVTERDERGIVVRDVLRTDPQKVPGWRFWSKNSSGRAKPIADGHVSQGALAIEGTTDDADLGLMQHEFRITPRHSYTVSGWMRGERLPPDAVVRIRLELIRTDGRLLGWNKTFLQTQLDGYLAWGHAHGVPLFLGEFGVHRPCFENDRGGLRWVEDVLDLADERGLPFTYHDYHDDSFGLYLGNGRVDPVRANHALIALFKRKLAPPAPGD
jgi:endoglucanase